MPASKSVPYFIDVSVPTLDGLYSALDPSPFRQRDLDPRAVEHIVQWAADSPPAAPIVLRVHVSPEEESDATRTETEDAVRNFFDYEVELLARRHGRNRTRMIRWLSVGLVIMTLLLSLHSLVGRLYPDSWFNDIVGEAFVIAGWVSLWVPIERLGFDGWLLRDQLQLYRRLAAMQVEVVGDGTVAG